MTTSSASLGADWLRRQTSRISSIDLVRGVVMVLMAIDHVRVYSGLPAGGPTLGIFLTRWITNFAAPAFVFLAGTAAYLQGRKLHDRSALSRFLVTRGAFLVLLELTVLRIAWTFNFDFSHYLLAGVVWMIGLCMMMMAVLVRLPMAVNLIGGLAIVVLHNVTDLFSGQLEDAFGSSGPNWFLKILYFGGTVDIGGSGPPLFILYVIVPWIGVMMTGYAFGTVMERSLERRRAICLRLGLALTALFIVLRAMSLYGDPRPWKETPPPAQSASAPSTQTPSAAHTTGRRECRPRSDF